MKKYPDLMNQGTFQKETDVMTDFLDMMIDVYYQMKARHLCKANPN
ncbi:hypothetical protein [Gramella sp. KN1008]|nr:hypothetical protein [Gramella sp. KN1008]